MYPNLKLRLWTTGIRQNRLAKMLMIDETTLSRIVNGFRQPSPEIRERIATALECDENWLFESTENGLSHPPMSSVAVDEDGPDTRRTARRNRAPISIQS